MRNAKIVLCLLLFFSLACSAQYNVTKLKVTQTLDFTGTNFRISGTNRLGFFGFLNSSNQLLTGAFADGQIAANHLNITAFDNNQFNLNTNFIPFWEMKTAGQGWDLNNQAAKDSAQKVLWSNATQAAKDSARWVAPFSILAGHINTSVMDVNYFQRAPTPTGEFTLKVGSFIWNLNNQAAKDSAQKTLSNTLDSTHIKQNSISEGDLAGNAAVLSLNSSTGHVNIAASSTIDIQKPDDQTLEPSVKNGSLTAGHIAAAQVVKRVNNLKDSVRVVAGTGISIATAGDSITITNTGATAPSDTVEHIYYPKDFMLPATAGANLATVTHMGGFEVLSFADDIARKASFLFVTPGDPENIISVSMVIGFYSAAGSNGDQVAIARNLYTMLGLSISLSLSDSQTSTPTIGGANEYSQLLFTGLSINGNTANQFHKLEIERNPLDSSDDMNGALNVLYVKIIYVVQN